MHPKGVPEILKNRERRRGNTSTAPREFVTTNSRLRIRSTALEPPLLEPKHLRGSTVLQVILMNNKD